MTKHDTITAALLVIGEEILSGRTQDENISYIAGSLDRIGVVLSEVRIVPDGIAEIAGAVNSLRQQFDYVLTTGGIGPTHDDVTTDAIATAFDTPIIEEHPHALQAMRECFPGEELGPSLRRMARVPEGAELVPNPISGAPGYMIGNVVVMAGVPQIMRTMMKSVVRRLDTGKRIASRSIRVDAIEGDVALALAGLQAEHPDVKIGSYPYFEPSGYGTYVVLRSTDADLIENAAEALCSLLDNHGTPYAEADAGS
ncbi:NMN amidohydrolase-like protein YfaY [Methyloligella halotolerans]|uniref:NMN amidohydrolase-like protein YfaY n=1 Tax=Methyloligella halotolerans TaxID=1177755 RepID=A0A1E2RZZ5_9HYPH|nr:molybdopterin-binding protein [Methyloligella halotolerans]ODA67732.1 NMN amidohydrolase-like protein YfaY [Methyloligella halotolerans]